MDRTENDPNLQRNSGRLGAVRTTRAILWIALAVFVVGCGGATAPPAEPAGGPGEVDLTVADSDPETTASEPGEGFVTRGASPSSELLPIEPDDAVWGSPTAPVTLIEISDFQCPFCARAYPTVETLKREYGNDKLRVVFKHNPLPFHQDAMPAAIAAQAVLMLGGDAAFWAYADRMFQNQRDLSDQNLVAWAGEVGVPRASFIQNLTNRQLQEQVQGDMDLARRIGATGTPNFRVNGSEISGAQPIDKFREVIDAELEAAKKLRVSGVAAERVYAERVAVNHEATAAPSRDAPAAKPAAQDTTIWKVELGKAPIIGPRDAPVTIVEFSEFQCPFCKRVQPTLEAVRQRYPKDVRIAFKHNPLPFHKRAQPAAMLAIEAQVERGDAGFWKVSDLLWRSSPNLEDSDLLDIAKQAQLNAGRVKLAISKQTHKSRVADDQLQAQDFNARGTPHFFINGFRVTGAQPLEKFVEVIDAQLARAKQLMADKKIGRAQVYAEIMKTAEGPPPPEQKTVAAPTKKNPSRGPAFAPVVVQVFSDFECPFCGRVMPTLEQLEKAFPGQVRIVYRHLPLPFHRHARLAAAASIEAFAQGGNPAFWKMHKLLYENQSQLERQDLESYARKVGLNIAKFNAALDAGTHDAAIDADMALAKQAGISGTPAAVINDYFVSGAQPLSEFKKVTKRAIKDLKQGKRKRP